MTLERDPSRMPTPLDGPAGMPADAAAPEAPLHQPVGADTALSRRKPLWREYAEAIIVAMLLAFAIRVFIVQAFKIPSGSMIPTLLIGDHILVSKLSYGIQWPGDCRFKMALPPPTQSFVVR